MPLLQQAYTAQQWPSPDNEHPYNNNTENITNLCSEGNFLRV